MVRAVREEKDSRQKIKLRKKVEKLRNTVLFQCFVAPEGRTDSKSRFAKAAGAEPSGRMREQK